MRKKEEKTKEIQGGKLIEEKEEKCEREVGG